MLNTSLLLFSKRPKTFSIDELKEFAEDNSTKRLCFATPNQSFQLHDGKEDVKKWMNVPFCDSIGPILEAECSISLITNKNNRYCYPCKSDAGVQSLEQFGAKYKDYVFLRDKLDLSISLSMRELVPGGGRTPIGELEYQVKYCAGDHRQEVEELARYLQNALNELPFFKHSDYVCAIPSSKPFIKDIVASLQGFSFTDISNLMVWQNKHGEMKNVANSLEKVELLGQSTLAISEAVDLQGKSVLLVDDLYESGMTMNYVALRLKQAGAKYVFGISLVKALQNK